MFGELAPEEMTAVNEGLAAFLGLGAWPRGVDTPPVQ
jgi:hypothetical protein